jgi:hypothetical protein
VNLVVVEKKSQHQMREKNGEKQMLSDDVPFVIKVPFLLFGPKSCVENWHQLREEPANKNTTAEQCAEMTATENPVFNGYEREFTNKAKLIRRKISQLQSLHGGECCRAVGE